LFCLNLAIDNCEVEVDALFSSGEFKARGIQLVIGSDNTSSRTDQWDLLKQAVIDFERAGEYKLQLVGKAQANLCECMNRIRNFDEASKLTWYSGVDLVFPGNDVKSLDQSRFDENTSTSIIGYRYLNLQQEEYVIRCIREGVKQCLFEMTFELCESVLLLLQDDNRRDFVKSTILSLLSKRLSK
jgi:hypothetical protein